MTLLLDCDVLLDVALNRAPHVADSREILDWCESHPGDGFVAWHTIANIFYMLSKENAPKKATEFIEGLLEFMEVAPVQTAEAKHALALSMRDFEDALQAAAAVAAGADYIVTRNLKDYAGSPIAAISPAAIKSRLS